MGIFRGGDTCAPTAADADDSFCDGGRRYEVFVEEISPGYDFRPNCEVQHIGAARCALRPPDYFVYPSTRAPRSAVGHWSCGSHRCRFSHMALWQEGQTGGVSQAPGTKEQSVG